MGDVEQQNFERTVIVAFFAMIVGLVLLMGGRPIEAVLACLFALSVNAWWSQQVATKPRDTERERLAFRLLEQLSVVETTEATEDAQAA